MLRKEPSDSDSALLHLSFSAFQSLSFYLTMRLDENLRQRTKAFASSIIHAYIRLPKYREEVAVLGKQMLRSGTSVASHAREASRARSDAEFCSKLDGLLQEADETQLWLELLIEDCNISDTALPVIHREAGELLAIFTTIVSKVRKNL
jgi:four helix bundle protein